MVVQQYLLQFFDSLEVSLEVNGYNSKVYYIVTQGAGFGDGVYRFPMTGNETVLDAISQINGLQRVASKKIWIARPTDNMGTMQRLEVSWEDITANANARSNYQILPGDRVFIAEDQSDRLGYEPGQDYRSHRAGDGILDPGSGYRHALFRQCAGGWRKPQWDFLAGLFAYGSPTLGLANQ